MKTTYQYHFYPDTKQKLELNHWLRICRYWYNRQLGDRFDWWEMNRTAINACPLITSTIVTRLWEYSRRELYVHSLYRNHLRSF
jgi:putative transposase